MRLSVVIGLFGLVTVQSCGPRPSSLPRPVQHTSIADYPVVPGAPSGITAFVDVGVVPMDTDRVLAHQTVLVEGGRVVALGATDSIAVPRGAVRIDGRDKYLMPGLGACHAHPSVPFFMGARFPQGEPRYVVLQLFGFLAHGVTTVRDMDHLDITPGVWTAGGRWRDRWGAPIRGIFSMNGSDALRLRAEADAGRVWNPRLYVTGQWAPLQYKWSGLQEGKASEEAGVSLPLPRLDSIAAYVAAFKAGGYDFLKLHDESPLVADSVFAAARRIGIPVEGHVVGTLAQAIAGGQRVADHAGSFQAGVPEDPDTAVHEKAMAAAVAAQRQAGMWSCDARGRYPKILVDSGAGPLLLLGNDGGTGQATLLEFVKDGLTPYQALAAGTKNFGRYLQTVHPRGGETGTIAVGRRADLLLVTGNPLADIRYADFGEFDYGMQHDSVPSTLVRVMIGGRSLEHAELSRRAAMVLLFKHLFNDTEQALTGAADTSLMQPWRGRLMQLDSIHREQQLALVERFVLAPNAPAGGMDSLRGPELLVDLFARQLGEMRAALPAAAQQPFDEHARVWLTARAAEGHPTKIDGVQP